MAVSDSYLAFVLEQLGGVKSVVTRRMFGGIGIYSDGVFFAVIDDDTLFFKVDEALAKRYIAQGMSPFTPIPGAKPMSSYYQVPVEVLEDEETLGRWAKDSLTAIGASTSRKRRAKSVKLTRRSKR